MISREEALNRTKAIAVKHGSLGHFIRELIIRGLFDSPVHSAEIIRAVRDEFGRKFPVSYVQTYMKQFLEAGVIRAQASPGQRGNSWRGTWVVSCHRGNHQRLKLAVD